MRPLMLKDEDLLLSRYEQPTWRRESNFNLPKSRTSIPYFIFLSVHAAGQVLHFSQFVEAKGKCPSPAVDTHALSEMTHDANICKLQNQLQKSQDHLSSLMQKEIEKLRSDTYKQHNELWSELRVETAKLHGEIQNRAEKLCGDIEKMLYEQRAHNDEMNYELRVLVQSTKFDDLKYFVGTFVSVFGMAAGVVLTVFRMTK